MKLTLAFCISFALAPFAGPGVDAFAGISAAVVSAAAHSVTAGSSLAGTTMSALMNTGYAVNCGIEVENWTKFLLTHAEVSLGGGALVNPPHSVLPSKKEAMVARKSSGTATGSYGVVSWLVEGLQRRFVVMWSAPYDPNFNSNWLGIGITQKGDVKHQSTWFNQMYYKSATDALGFERKKFLWNILPIIYRDDKIQVVGVMGSSRQAKVKIIVRPVNTSDLAGPIKFLLNSKAK